MSQTRKRYMLKLIIRCALLLTVIGLYFFYPQSFQVLDGMNFFKTFSPLHLLWLLWMNDMIQQIIPLRTKLALGSQKVFAFRFSAAKKEISKEELKKHIKSMNVGAIKVFILWWAFIGVLAALYFLGIFDRKIMFLFTPAFYVCDLICVLIWCPFRLIMGNRCCTTCRIFNWDHFMMFSPIVFMGGFFAVSLFAMSMVALIVWELCVLIYPERFWERSNAALKCSECTDKLCTQYCRKLR